MTIKWTIRNKLLAAFGGALLMLVLLVVVNWVLMNKSIAAARVAHDEAFVGANLAKDIQMDVVMVWQWLTDISATRAAPGFDDGFAEAEQYAQKFQADIASLKELSPQDSEKLDQLNIAFEQFYLEGQKMAQQYIDGGPEYGNPAMENFDTYAAELTAQMDELVTRKSVEAEASLQHAIDQNMQSRNIGIAVAVIALFSGLIATFFLSRNIAKPMLTLTEVGLRLSNGDAQLVGVDRQALDKINTRQDELGQLGQAFSRMVDYFKEIADAAGRLAEGDLTAETHPRGSTDLLGNAFSQMVDNLRHLVGEVAQSATQLNHASDQLSDVAGQTSQVTSHIATAIQQVSQGTQQQAGSILQTKASIEQVSQAVNGVATGAQEQAQAITQTSQSLGQLAESIRSITGSTKKQSQVVGQAKAANSTLEIAVVQITERTAQVADFIKANLQTAQSGQQTSRQAITGIDQLGATTEQLAQRIRELGKRSAQIGAIVETIDDIAGQTNLLALNAAIEAARAGEHGKGFAVVADEVRKLAERSSQATKEIQVMIEAVQAGAEQAVEAMGRAGKDVQMGVTLTRQAGAAFEAITTGTAGSAEQIEATLKAVEVIRTAAEQLRKSIESVDQVAEQNLTAAQGMQGASEAVLNSMEQVSAVVEENSAITEEMAASANEVTAAIENIALVSEENSASVEEVSASTEEMSAQVHEVAASVKTLTEMAQALQALVAQFKLADPTFTQPTLSQVAVTPAGQSHGWATPLAVVERNGYH